MPALPHPTASSAHALLGARSKLKREARQWKARALVAERVMAEGREAHEVGQWVMQCFESREDFDRATGADDPNDLQPGQSPNLDLDAWRASQLGRGMVAAILSFRRSSA